MKKILSVISIFVALACVSASCQKEFKEVLGENSELTITATKEGGGTKVSADDDGSSLVLKWQEDDMFIGFDDATTPNTYAFAVTKVEGGKATLTRIIAGSDKGTAKKDPSNGTKMYMFYAPGMKAGDINTDNKSLTVDISRQTAEVPVLMTAIGTVEAGKLNLEFEVRTALIGVKAPVMAAGSTDYSNIVLTSTGTLNNQVKFDLDETNGTLEPTYSQVTDVTSITKVAEFTSSGEKKGPAVIYIAACPLETEAKLSFTTDNEEFFTTEDAVTMAAGNFYYLSEPEFKKPRIIKVLFANEKTKDTFDYGTQGTVENAFTFVAGDMIKVANDSNTEDCVVKIDEVTGEASISTQLEGVLKAIYPASKASVSGSVITPIASSDNVSATQDGLLQNAIVAVAENIAADAETASFVNNNNTAVYKIVLPDDTKMLTVKSLMPTVTGTARSGDAVAITTETDDAKKTVVTVKPSTGAEAIPNPCYVCLKAGVNFSDLSFDAATETKDESGTNVSIVGEMKGIPSRYIKASKNATVAKNVYTIDGFNWHGYVKFGEVKWATKNIGAEEEWDAGYYFAWAEIEGHKLDASKEYSTETVADAFKADFDSFDFSDSRYTSSKDKAGGFAYSFTSSGSSYSKYYINAPYSGAKTTSNTSGSYTQYTSSASSVLKLSDNAAYYNWGGAWTMPSGIDAKCQYFWNTSNVTFKWETNYKGSGKNGMHFTQGPLEVFFPATGYGSSLQLLENNKSCKYWTRNVNTSNYQVYAGVIKDNGTASSIPTSASYITNDTYRSRGCPIRPISTD